MLTSFFREHTQSWSFSGKRILHFAPEIMIHNYIISDGPGDYCCVDFDPDLYGEIQGVKFCDITDIAYPDNHFDFFLANHVLEHIPDDRKAMAEINRVLKPGGRAILLVPISLKLEQTYEDPDVKTPKDRKKYFGQSDHVRVYGQDYKNRLEAANFSVDVNQFAKHYSKAALYGLNPKEMIYIATKMDQGRL